MQVECIFIYAYLYIFCAYPGIGIGPRVRHLWEILPGPAGITISTRKWLACHFLEIRRPMVRGRAAEKSHKWDFLPFFHKIPESPWRTMGFPERRYNNRSNWDGNFW